MLRKILPVLLIVTGLGAGAGAGLALRPDQMALENPCGPSPDDHAAATDEHGDGYETGDQLTFVELNNQFVVPVVRDGRIGSLVVMSVELATQPGLTEIIYQNEPLLRDGFLQVMFDHANAGGFDGQFTASHRMNALMSALLETANQIMGPSTVTKVLLNNISRQDG